VGTDAVHSTATAFSGAATVYEQSRPGYPPEALTWLGEHLGLGPGRKVLDLAAGTGKLTRGLLALGATVIAMEPVEAMRATLAEAVPGAIVVAGVAQVMPLGTGTVDALTVAQALHWFATEDAVAEMHRVLGAGLGWRWCGTDEISRTRCRQRCSVSWIRGAATPRQRPPVRGVAPSRMPATAHRVSWSRPSDGCNGDNPSMSTVWRDAWPR